MPAAADSDLELLAAREPQRRSNVGRAGALHDQGWMLVVCGVPESARFVVARVARADDVSAQLSRELGDGGVAQNAGLVRGCSHAKNLRLVGVQRSTPPAGRQHSVSTQVSAPLAARNRSSIASQYSMPSGI